MAVENGKLTEKSVRIIIIAVSFLLLAGVVIFLFVFNANYAKIYGSPSVTHGKADFEGVELRNRSVACNLAGEWEFFYNKWIVTDNYDGEPDGMISMPNLWTYKNYGNGALPKSGYASYRLTVENIQEDVDVTVYRHNGNFAYRVFINGELHRESGVMSKTAKETEVGAYSKKIPYKTDGRPLEIVIEVSANNAGGFNAAPWLSYDFAVPEYGTKLRSFTYAALGIATAAVALSILVFIFFKYKRDITVTAFLCVIFIHFLFSKDMLYVMPVPIVAAMVVELVTAVAAIVLFVAHLHANGIALNRAYVVADVAVVAVGLILLPIFYGTPLAVGFACLPLLVGVSYVVPIARSGKISAVQRGVYAVILIFLTSIFLFELSDWLGLLVFGTEFIFSFALMFIIMAIAVMWLWKIAEAAGVAIRVSNLECELTTARQQALKAQIKPHFIYNALTAIQARYRNGLEEGDGAIERFARHLRTITDSDNDESIAFEDEVRNVINYFELENIRVDGALNLYLDLAYNDFCVPVLSIQPLIENAIRHSGIREIEDGYIELKSEKCDGIITVTVSDNGKGFDTAVVAEGVGLSNTRKRLELFGAKMKVESRLNCGTKIIIELCDKEDTAKK